MFGILSFLFKIRGLLSIVVLSASAYGAWIHVKGMNAEIETLKIDNTKLSAAVLASEKINTVLRGSINEQNAAIEKLRLDGEMRAKRNATALAAANKTAAIQKKRAEAIMKMEPTSTNICDSAETLLGMELQ